MLENVCPKYFICLHIFKTYFFSTGIYYCYLVFLIYFYADPNLSHDMDQSMLDPDPHSTSLILFLILQALDYRGNKSPFSNQIVQYSEFTMDTNQSITIPADDDIGIRFILTVSVIKVFCGEGIQVKIKKGKREREGLFWGRGGKQMFWRKFFFFLSNQGKGVNYSRFAKFFTRQFNLPTYLLWLR